MAGDSPCLAGPRPEQDSVTYLCFVPFARYDLNQHGNVLFECPLRILICVRKLCDLGYVTHSDLLLRAVSHMLLLMMPRVLKKVCRKSIVGHCSVCLCFLTCFTRKRKGVTCCVTR